MTLTMIPRGWLITNLTIVILNPEVTRAMGQNRSSLIPFCILAAGLGLFGLSGNSPVLGENLDEAWEMALRHDNLLQANRQEVAAARCEHAAASRSWLPSVSNQTNYFFLSDAPSLSFDQGPVPIEESMVNDRFVVNTMTMSMPVYQGGQIRSNIARSLSRSHATRYEREKAELDLKYEVARAYIDVLKSQWLLQVARSTVSSLTSHEKDVRSMFEQGLVSKNDLLAVQVSHANARRQLFQATNVRDLALAGYNRYLGQTMDRPVELVDLEDSGVRYSQEQMIATALSRRPELHSLRLQARAYFEEAHVKRGDYLPKASVQGVYNYIENDNLRPNNIFAVDLNVKWKPIDGGVAHRQEAALKHRAAAMIRRLEDARSKVSLEVRRAWLTLEEKRKGIDVARMALEQAKENLRITRNQYRHGVGTNTEVLQAETLRTESRKNYYNAIYDAARSEFELKRAAGIL